MNSYEAYLTYSNIKLHFTSKSYSYVKYHGRSSIYNPATWNKLPSKYLFDKFSNKYPQSFKFYCIAAWLNSTKISWIKDIDNDEYICYYNTLIRNTSNLGYTLRNDLKTLNVETFKEMFDVKVFETIVLNKTVSQESLVVLDKLTGCLSKITGSKLYMREVFKLKKYSEFFIFEDLAQYASIIKDQYPKIR